MSRIRNEIWCLVAWTVAVTAFGIWDLADDFLPVRAHDAVFHSLFGQTMLWLAGLAALHLIYRAARRSDAIQRRAREELRASEQRYRALFEHMNEGFALHEMIYDAKGAPVDCRFLSVNPAFERLTGLRAQEIVGRTVREAIPGIEDEWTLKYSQVVESGEAARFEQRFGRLGRTFSVEAFRFAPGGFACTFTDVTEQRLREERVAKSEARLSAMLQSMDDLVFVLDGDGRFETFAQDGRRGDLLVAPAVFEGCRFSEVLPPAVAGSLDLAIARMRETGRTQSLEYELQPNGTTTLWNARVSPLSGPDPGMRGCVVVARNVTMQRLDEQRLRQRNRFLEGIEKISSILLGSADTPATFDRVAEEVAAMTGFPRVVISLVPAAPAGAALRVVGLCGGDIGEHSDVDLLPGNSVSGRAVLERAPVTREGGDSVERDVHPRFRGTGFNRLMAVPILRDGEALGSILVADRRSERFESVLTQVLNGVANHIAIHLARVETERARYRNEVELLSIYDHAPVVMALLDESAEVIRCNRAAHEFAGVRHDAGQRVRPGELIGCLGAHQNAGGCGHGPSCGRCTLRMAILDTIATGVAHRQVEVRKQVAIGRETRTVDLLVSTARLELEGQRRVLLVMEDVTKARLAEDRVREQAALLDVTRDAIFVHDATGRILYWNKGAEVLYRVPRAEAVGRRVEEVIITKSGETGTGPTEVVGGVRECQQTTRDGREIVVQSRRSEICDDSGQVRSILVVTTDITENHRLNRHLLRAQRLESIGTLASGIAHDLNNILAPIMMSVGLLRPQCDKDGQSVLETIETCVRRGSDIVRQVLLFARGVDGQRIALQPRHMLSDVLRIMRETFPRSISITTGVGRDPWSVIGDPTQVQQVLLNICVNARDAMPHGGELRVTVRNRTILPEEPRSHPRAEPGRYVQIEISDTGTGMPPEIVEKIFDPFFTTKPQGQGTGLGLATSLGIVEKHGGFIHVDSTVGRGSTFYIHLPACDGAPAPAAASEAPVPAGDGARILVVDDEPAVRKVVQYMLQTAGYRVAVACDGQDAVDLLRDDTEGFVLIVTDLMMPRLDGPRMIAALRESRPALPIIAMTGVGEERRVQEAMNAGVKFVLNKPFESAELLRVIHRVRAAPAGLSPAEG